MVALIGCSSIFLYLFGNDTANIIMTYAKMQTTNSTQSGQKVSFLTDDGVLIVGTYYPPAASNKKTTTDAIILLHMLGRDRSDWNSFASTLSNGTNGFAALSIDLRGHGESVNQHGKAISFQSFTPDDFNKMMLDVKAAKHFLVTQ
jgi:alpha-beta hydrolase superfamily lysophospholipase